MPLITGQILEPECIFCLISRRSYSFANLIRFAYHFVKQILSKFLFFLFFVKNQCFKVFKNNGLTYQITNANIYPVVYNFLQFFPFAVVLLFYLVIYFLVIASYNVIHNKRSIIKNFKKINFINVPEHEFPLNALFWHCFKIFKAKYFFNIHV